MQTSYTQRLPQKLTGYLLAFILVIIAAGCGGSGSSDGEDENVGDPTPATGQFEFVVARVGPIVAVRVGETAILSDNNSYTASTQPLSFSWSFSHKPEGSSAVLQNANTENSSFIADARGTYMVQLVATAEGISSKRAIQLVVATVAPERPTGPFNHQGLSSSCVSCHNDNFGNIRSKAQNHVATGNTCETCHTPLGFPLVANVDHQEVFGNCSECHNGVTAIGKSEFHTPTTVECDECHNTNSFITLEPDGSFDHSTITRACSGCHNGTVAIGKTPDTADSPPGTHPVTTSECGYCHTTVSFLNAYPDHTGPDVVGNRCDSCHGSSASGEPSGHPVMTAADLSTIDCGACHGVTSIIQNEKQ